MPRNLSLRPRVLSTNRSQLRESSTPHPELTVETHPALAIRYAEDDEVQSEIEDQTLKAHTPPIGDVNYPPYSMTTEPFRKELERLHVRSEVKILSDPLYIPYSSDKRAFFNQTGRTGFQAFKYSFKISPEADEMCVMWDYNIGLVRITPFFKALAYTKTIPAKAIGMTDGLTAMCHSITGGTLKAQGYWMPFEAAKALAATFCWDIRYALTPVFGAEFVDLCLEPDDPEYKNFEIDKGIVARCREDIEKRTLQNGREGSCTATDEAVYDDTVCQSDLGVSRSTRLASTRPGPLRSTRINKSRTDPYGLPNHRQQSVECQPRHASVSMSSMSNGESRSLKRSSSEANSDPRSVTTEYQSLAKRRRMIRTQITEREAEAVYALLRLSKCGVDY